MEEVLRNGQSSLNALPHSSFPASAVETELAPPAQPSLEVVDELPTRGHNDMGLDAPLWEHGANEEYVDAGEEVRMEGVYASESKMTIEGVTLCAYELYSLLALD